MVAKILDIEVTRGMARFRIAACYTVRVDGFKGAREKAGTE